MASVLNETAAASESAQFILRRLGDAISRVAICIAGIALLTIVVINGANVFGRYFLGAPISWAEELMLFLMVLVIFAGATTVTWRGAHIGIAIFTERLPPLWRRVVAIGTGLISFSILIAIGMVSLDIVSTLYVFDQRSDAMELPIWIPQSSVVMGMFLMALMLVLRFACAWHDLKQLHALPDSGNVHQ